MFKGQFKGQEWRDYLENILVAIFLALFVRTFIFTGYKVPSSSMAPALMPGDFIFSFRLPYGLKLPLTQTKLIVTSPQRGEVVVFSFPEQPRVSYVKRVIGLPGDRIEIKNGELVINGQKLKYLEKTASLIQDLPGYDLFSVLEEQAPEGARFVIFKKQGPRKSFGPLIVPPSEVFLLGDNRDASDDSRYWGTVPMEKIEGRVLLVWLSLDWNKKWGDGQFPHLRQDRIFTWVH